MEIAADAPSRNLALVAIPAERVKTPPISRQGGVPRVGKPSAQASDDVV